MEFDRRKFPNPGEMMSELRAMGLRVTLWVHPFASALSSAVGRGDFWLKSTLTRGYGTWWNGLAKSLDVTNQAAVSWFRGCLRALADEFDITSYKFDAGELSWLPAGYTTSTELSIPNEYSRRYAETCFSVDPDRRALEVRVGVRTQHLPVFVRMMDKDSVWSDDNGLSTLIPHALTFGVLGYPYVLPDMVGGNAYRGIPDRELYVRWLAATVLMPSIQISIPPWQYDDDVVAVAHSLLALREQFADRIIELARDSTVTGAPIMRPLWWVDPTDDTSQLIDSEFLLGDDVLVAPVLERAAVSRLVYLPSGTWRHHQTRDVFGGRKWHRCEAGLADLPVFTRVAPNDDGKTTEASPTVKSEIEQASSSSVTSDQLFGVDADQPAVIDLRSVEVPNEASEVKVVEDFVECSSEAALQSMSIKSDDASAHRGNAESPGADESSVHSWELV